LIILNKIQGQYQSGDRLSIFTFIDVQSAFLSKFHP